MKRLLTLANLRLGIELILVIAALFIVSTRITPTEAATAPAVPAVPNGAAWYICNTPSGVAVLMNRIHIYCLSTTPAMSGIFYFTVPTAPDSAAASRFMSVFQSAVLTNQRLELLVDPADTSGTTFGCVAADCRRIYGAELGK